MPFFMNALSVPVDEVKKANIKPLLEYLEGKVLPGIACLNDK